VLRDRSAEHSSLKVLWPPCVADADIIFSSCGFFYLSFSSPILSRRTLDVHHNSTHGVALGGLVRIWDAGLKHTARGSLKIQDAKIAKNLPPGHHRTNSAGYIFATKARIHNLKKNLLNSNPHVLIAI